MPDATQPVPPRILAVQQLGATLPAQVARAAALGFSHVLLPPPFLTGPRGDRFAPASLTDAGDALGKGGMAALANSARQHGVALLLDVQLNRLAPGTGATLGQGLFHAPDPAALLDARHKLDMDADLAQPLEAAGATSLGQFWAGHLARWQAEGVAGFRLLGLHAVPPPLLPALLTPMRQPGAQLFAWTPGLPAEAHRALRGQGLAGVFSSLPWWDLRAPWLWHELTELLAIAPVIAAPEAPGTALSLPQNPAEAPAWYRRIACLAAALGQGWMAMAGRETVAGADQSAFLQALNAAIAATPALAFAAAPSRPTGDGGTILTVLRHDTPDRRFANQSVLTVVNTDPEHRQAVDTALLLAPLGGRMCPPRQILPAGEALTMAPGLLWLEPAEARMFCAEAIKSSATLARVDEAGARLAAAGPRLAIENLDPCVDGGALPVKRTAGEAVIVEADVVFDGHDKIAVALRHRCQGGAWLESPMRPLGNDRWRGEFPLTMLGRYDYSVIAWRDVFESYRDEIAKKSTAGVDITLELAEGETLLRAALKHGASANPLESLARRIAAAGATEKRDLLLAPGTARLMAAADTRPFAVQSPVVAVDAERLEARFASWYEVFPRSLSDDEGRHGSFADVQRHLPRIRDMGFDVLYFPPIHPIGRINRKGRNNTLTPAPGDPGSPYAIGGEAGGHDALHPELGTLDDFRCLREAAAAHGLELAIDFAVQCAPDHPWLREHKDWFDWRPDGTIKYAENPPKKYEDIVNVDFYAPGAVPGLWMELCRVVLFWAGQGVRLFRVDNPHTKPFPFWQWMIHEVRQRYPDAIFLAEAFTRPKVMYQLAKIGFSQSYTYFTWRNTKRELQDYSTELATQAPRDFFRPHFFVNTPDINPVFLQNSGRPGFLIRAALAATLSGLWGVYNGFELCEAAALPGREEYANSEKYQLRAWDWQRPGNIIAEITALNRIRRDNPALQSHLGITFHTAFNDAVLYFEKATADRSNVVLVAVSLDPSQAQEADFEIPLWRFGLTDEAALHAEDLLGGAAWTWHGKMQHMRLTPEQPYAIWRVRAA